jgi:hypothetical protein
MFICAGESRVRDRVALIAAVLLVVSAAWYALILARITVPAPPSDTADTAGSLRAWYAWQAVVERQQWVVSVLAVLGLGTLAVAVGRLIDGRSPVRDRAAAIAVASGAGAWAVGNLLQIGGRRATGLLAAHGNPIEAVNAIAFTVDVATAVFEAAALIAVGAGLLALSAGRPRDPRRYVGIAAGLLVTGLGAAYAVDNGTFTDVYTVGVGLLALPGWISVQQAPDRSRTG